MSSGTSESSMRLNLQIWRQNDARSVGRLVTYQIDGITPDMSFLEMLDILNENLTKKGEDPVAFDHDCREGICGSCGIVINGKAHGGMPLTTTCQLYMRHFRNGDTITLEPWRAKAFPVIKDLVVDRSSMDRIISAGGYISANVGSAPDGNSILIGKEQVEHAFDAAACIQCGACVAACKNASAMLFTSAKIEHLHSLPQGKIEKARRVKSMVAQMDKEQFGNCTNEGECEAVCPKGIKMMYITNMNREWRRANFSTRPEVE